MTKSSLKVIKAGPYISVQDEGRPGYIRSGVSRGGAMDAPALEEGRLLVGNERGLAAVEMLGIGGSFQAVDERITGALTGAFFAAKIGREVIEPYTSFVLQPGQVLDIGTSKGGNYGYLSISGGFETDLVLGSRSTHIRAGFGGFEGRCLRQGDILPVGSSNERSTVFHLPKRIEKTTEVIRIIYGAQAPMFGADELRRFIQTRFEITHGIDRMGARLTTDADPIHMEQGLVAISGAIALGDIQVAGSGRPIVLLADRQPTGGYPRIGTIIGADIASFVQKPAGTKVRFEPVSESHAIDALRIMSEKQDTLSQQLVKSLVDPFESHRLLSQNLISGVVSTRTSSSNEEPRS